MVASTSVILKKKHKNLCSIHADIPQLTMTFNAEILPNMHYRTFGLFVQLSS